MLFAASLAAQGVPLGTAGAFGVLAGSEVTNTGSSVVYGSVGVWPGTSIGGFPPGTIFPGSGAFHSADTVAQQAQFDLGVAYDDASGRACGTVVPGGLLGGLTLTPGVYCMDTADLTGTLTLDWRIHLPDRQRADHGTWLLRGHDQRCRFLRCLLASHEQRGHRYNQLDGRNHSGPDQHHTEYECDLERSRTCA
jgi:hypothetical protein